MPAPSTEGVRSYTGPQEQNGVTLHSLTATPAATRFEIQVPSYAGESCTTQIRLTAEDGTLLKPERGEGGHVDETDPASDYRMTYYYDAVPENSQSVTMTVYKVDYSAQPETAQVVATFTVPLA